MVINLWEFVKFCLFDCNQNLGANLTMGWSLVYTICLYCVCSGLWYGMVNDVVWCG